jgi:hypothetical protein
VEHLVGHYDESDRLYQGLLDVSNATWPDPRRAVLAVRGRSRRMNVVRVLNIRIKLETQPAR